jgi:hypothetical protein
MMMQTLLNPMTFQEALLTLVRTSPLVPDPDRSALIEKITNNTLPEADQQSIATLLATFARAQADELPKQQQALSQFLHSLEK